MIKCAVTNKEFATKSEYFAHLKANKQTILAAKKADIKTKENKGVLGFYDEKNKSVKAIPDMDDEYIYPIISNTNYFDHHQDVHLKGSMSKTAKEQNGKVYYVADHTLQIDQVIATPKNVEVMLLKLNWSDLGKNYEGKTEALVYKIPKSKIIHEKFKRMIEDGESLQNSIRMQYIKLGIGVNSTDEEFKQEYEYWNKHYSSIVNKEKVDEVGMFFGIEELKLTLEGSAVLFGSNDATPTKTEAVSDTSDKQEPSIDTRLMPELEKLLEQSKI